MGKKHKKTPPALKKAAENKRYVSAVHGDKIYYTKEFYRAMYDAVHNGKGAVDAYASLGFDVRELGEDRAFAAARRARAAKRGAARADSPARTARRRAASVR